MILLCVLGAPACKGSGGGGGTTAEAPKDTRPMAEAMVGRFLVDVDRLEGTPTVAALPPEKRKEAVEMARKMVGSLSFEFGADKSYAVSLAGKTNAGTWALQKSEKDKVIIKVTETGGESEEVTLQRSATGLSLIRPDGDTLPLKPAG